MERKREEERESPRINNEIDRSKDFFLYIAFVP